MAAPVNLANPRPRAIEISTWPAVILQKYEQEHVIKTKELGPVSKCQRSANELLRNLSRHFKTLSFLEDEQPVTDELGPRRDFIFSRHSNTENTSVVWESRLDVDLQIQLDFVGSVIKMNPNSYDIWCQRRMVAEKLGANAASNELEFTEEILCVDAKNKYAWSHRQWVFQTFGGGENELAFCGKLIEDDIYNDSAWNQRLFVVTRYGTGVEEVDYAMIAILNEPENEYPWIYLRRLYGEIKVDDYKWKIEVDRGKLDYLFDSVIDTTSVLEPRKSIGRRYHIKSLEMNIIMNREKYVNALDTLLDLVCFGYEPTCRVRAAIETLCPSIEYQLGFLQSIYSILEFAYPLDTQYWKCRVDRVRWLKSMKKRGSVHHL